MRDNQIIDRLKRQDQSVMPFDDFLDNFRKKLIDYDQVQHRLSGLQAAYTISSAMCASADRLKNRLNFRLDTELPQRRMVELGKMPGSSWRDF